MASLLTTLLEATHQSDVVIKSGKTIDEIAAENNGQLPLGRLLVSGVPQPVELNAKISFMDDRLLVSVDAAHASVSDALKNKGYVAISQGTQVSKFAGKKGFPSILAKAGETAASTPPAWNR